jgi:hypothetical protein
VPVSAIVAFVAGLLLSCPYTPLGRSCVTVPAAIRAITKIASAGHPRIYFRILANVKASTAVVSVLLILCSTGSCSTITGEDQTALDLFEQLCQAEGGSQAFGKAHDVSGIFMNTWSGQCRRCSTVLRASGYQFVEFRFTGSPPEFPGSFVKAPGLYRMSLKPKGHPDCETFYQRYKYEMEQGRI